MTLCVNCGVELDDGLKICPLCGKDPENKGEQEQISGNISFRNYSASKKRKQKVSLGNKRNNSLFGNRCLYHP